MSRLQHFTPLPLFTGYCPVDWLMWATFNILCLWPRLFLPGRRELHFSLCFISIAPGMRAFQARFLPSMPPSMLSLYTYFLALFAPLFLVCLAFDRSLRQTPRFGACDVLGYVTVLLTVRQWAFFTSLRAAAARILTSTSSLNPFACLVIPAWKGVCALSASAERATRRLTRHRVRRGKCSALASAMGEAPMYGLDERLLSCCVLSRCDVADIVRFGAASSRCLSASRLAFSSVNSVNFNPTSARHFLTSRESLRVIVSCCGGTLRSLSFRNVPLPVGDLLSALRSSGGCANLEELTTFMGDPSIHDLQLATNVFHPNHPYCYSESECTFVHSKLPVWTLGGVKALLDAAPRLSSFSALIAGRPGVLAQAVGILPCRGVLRVLAAVRDDGERSSIVPIAEMLELCTALTKCSNVDEPSLERCLGRDEESASLFARTDMLARALQVNTSLRVLTLTEHWISQAHVLALIAVLEARQPPLVLHLICNDQRYQLMA